MPANERPEYYAAPLENREDIIGWLSDHQSYYRGYRESCPLAWNVKCYTADLSAEHLIEVYRKQGGYGPDDRWLDFPEWRGPAIAIHGTKEDRLCDYAIEDAQRMAIDTDCYRSLWKGDYLDAKYEFAGRSGGWLIIVRFEGTDLSRMDSDGFREYLDELPDATLRNLYELAVQNDHDFRPQAVRDEIELRAAFVWIDYYCRDIPRPKKTQGELTLADA